MSHRLRPARPLAGGLVAALALAACQVPAPPPPGAALGATAGFRFVTGRLAAEGLTGLVGSDGVLGQNTANYLLRQAAAAIPAPLLATSALKVSGPGYAQTYPVAADGTWTVEAKPGAAATLEALVPDGAGGSFKAVRTIDVPAAPPGVPAAFDVGSLVTRRTGSIQGVVRLAGASPDETPEGADVFFAGGTSIVGKAGRQGRFTLTSVPEGTWNVVVTLPGFKRALLAGQVVAAGRPLVVADPVTLERDPGALPTGLSGRIEDGVGQPLLGATVSAFPLAPVAGDPTSFVAITDARGAYAFRNLPAGPYELQVYRPFYQVPPAVRATVVAGVVVPVDAQRLAAAAIYFGKAQGQVLDENGQPLDGAVVQTEPAVADQQFTDATGRFTLDRVMAGTYTLHVAAGGYRAFARELTVRNAAGVVEQLGTITLEREP